MTNSSGGNGDGRFGIQVSDGATLATEDCAIAGSSGTGIAVYHSGTWVSLAGTVIRGTLPSVDLGGGVGVYAAEQGGWAPPSLVLRDSAIADNWVAGVWLAGAGSYARTGNEISGSTTVTHGETTSCGDGVYAQGTQAWDGSVGLLISDSRLPSNEGGGLFLDDAYAQLSGNTWEGNEPDLWVQGDACLAPRDDYGSVPTSEICPTWNRPACGLAFSLALVTEEIETGRSRSPPVPFALPAPVRGW